VERNKTFSTSYFIVVAVNACKCVVAPIPGCTTLIEIYSSLGQSYFIRENTAICFPLNTVLLVREVKANCIGHAIVRGKINVGTVVAPYGNEQVELGQSGNLLCKACKCGFDTVDDCLSHFNLPTVEVRFDMAANNNDK
jgi:hypothetical protein